ncbi:MAG: nucleotide exchange factor GrpE [Pirellulales bacterium]|nr:nucleotide exchange factor GrpE [Pirellulales bacterium]
MADAQPQDPSRPNNEAENELSSADDLNQLRDDLTEATNRALRAQADLENYRKRAQREMDDERRYANMPLLKDLLPVLDNISRAVESAEKTHDVQGLLTGVQMIGKQLEDALARFGCRRIEALHQPFDPHLHQAILQQPTTEHDENTVVGVAQEGYKLHDRVVRPTQVIVSKSP